MKIISVNISEKKGTVKKPVPVVVLHAEGVKGDAHAGKWHRQVSLLGIESFRKFEQLAGRELALGEFAENLTTEGLILHHCKPFDLITIGGVVLEVTQIGKKCHGDSCAIYREVGNCVMPKEGIFCRVLAGGEVRAGDLFEYHPKTVKALIITLSDRASSGEYPDRSGPAIIERVHHLFAAQGWPVEIDHRIVPDEATLLRQIIMQEAEKFDIVITTGGTGLGPRDITVDTITPLIHKEIPGIMEMIRMKYGAANPNALISRSIAGMIGNTMVFALPGSVKAVNEYMEEIEKIVIHLMFMVSGIDRH
jgi:molybdopterin adenylyltransferase